MFQTLKYLAVVGGVTFVAGNRLLRRVAQKYVTQTHTHTHIQCTHTHTIVHKCCVYFMDLHGHVDLPTRVNVLLNACVFMA